MFFERINLLYTEKGLKYLICEDLCEILNIGKNTAYKLLKNNDIPNRRLGKKYIIPKFGVIEYLKGVQL